MGRMSPRALSYLWLLGILAFSTAQSLNQTPMQSPHVSQSEWDDLNYQVGGRLFRSAPFAKPCFTRPFPSPSCVQVQDGYVDEETRANTSSAYIQSQWETCQVTGEQCLLDYTNPKNEEPTTRKCLPGSIPRYFVDVRSPKDIAAAFLFSKKTRVPIVIKNTGHDYKGRSSAPGSLALWTHNLKKLTYNSEFTPEGCSHSSPGVTAGAGVQWGEAYPFAEKNNITLVGGSDKTVGVVGGWLQGGGHGALSNTMGLGVDRVLQFKIVTPDGHHRVVNECQNEDLFFALRGGGGGTFGVVTEATILASPPVKLQSLILTLKSPSATKRMWSILADNALKWADEGWGGFSTSQVVILINPKLSSQEARESLAPLIDFGKSLPADEVELDIIEFPTWGAFFDVFTKDHVAVVGVSLALSSRLISKENVKTASRREELVSALLAANTATPGLIILISAPSSFPSSGKTSVTEAWRSSLYHVTVISPWNWNATTEEKRQNYKRASDSIDNLRRITPDAAYLNEADVYEPNHEVAFWGEHYPKLLRLKEKYDPNHLLDCWHCVGWKRNSARFSCYL